MCVYLYVHMYVSVSVSICMYFCMYLYVSLYVFICVYMYVTVCICICICVYLCMYMCLSTLIGWETELEAQNLPRSRSEVISSEGVGRRQTGEPLLRVEGLLWKRLECSSIR